MTEEIVKEAVARYIMFHKYTIPATHVRPLKGGGPCAAWWWDALAVYL